MVKRRESKIEDNILIYDCKPYYINEKSHVFTITVPWSKVKEMGWDKQSKLKVLISKWEEIENETKKTAIN